jgi:hypothetical protein
MLVQRKWMYLESIFVGSDDIRHQLPQVRAGEGFRKTRLHSLLDSLLLKGAKEADTD